MKKKFTFKIGFCCLLLQSIIVQLNAQKKTINPIQKPDSIYRIMKKVADWQIDSIKNHGFRHAELDWTNGALYAGIIQFAEIANDSHYYQFLRGIGERNQWSLNHRGNRYHADYYRVGDMYCRMYNVYHEPVMIADLKMLADTLIQRPHTETLEWKDNIGAREWAWCDALFMGPPPLADLAKVTGEQKYMDLCNKLWWKTTDYLYLPSENLYYRDGSFLNKEEKNGKPVMWSRGNGWVIGGLTQVLNYMPSNYPERAKWITLFKEMSNKIASIQQADGTWHASLLDPASFPVKETSGTGFYCYALAWGINNGILDADKFKPVVLKAWKALSESVHPGGMLGSVQKIGGSPDLVTPNDTEVYGVGAFLLAGSQVMELSLKQMPKSFIKVKNTKATPETLNNLLHILKTYKKVRRYTNLLDGKRITSNSLVTEGTILYLPTN